MNAFRHSQAAKVEVELDYAAQHFRLLVRDDGIGIEQQVLQSGRDGHWGLPGMRERADKIGAKLRVWSRPARGTEVELTVPGNIAFESKSSNRPRWLARLLSKTTAAAEGERPVAMNPRTGETLGECHESNEEGCSPSRNSN